MNLLKTGIYVLNFSWILTQVVFGQNSYGPSPAYSIPAVTGYQDNQTILFQPSDYPDRIILNLAEDPLKSVGVSWRTSPNQTSGKVQLAEAGHGPQFLAHIRELTAETEFLRVEHEVNPTVEANYHAVVLEGLEAGKKYLYRVGEGEFWSEWFQFQMPVEEEGVTFLYFGDAQNGVKDHWSRLIRQAVLNHPETDFMLHAGDLINRHNNDLEWGEWFYAGGFFHATVPSVMTPGNHEYGKDGKLSPQWRPQFNLPLNGPEGLEETCYQVNYPNLKVISLNAEQIEESPLLKQKQVEWLDSILYHDPRDWTVITIHHPFYSTKENRDNADLRKHFKPVIDKYKVDMVLQGHDHAYGRGTIGPNQNGGIREVKSEPEGTVYVVSMAGIKMYEAWSFPWMERMAADTQMYQVIHINKGVLKYQAFTAAGDLYDAFELHKQKERHNLLINQIPEVLEKE